MKHVISFIFIVLVYIAHGTGPEGTRVTAELVDQYQNGSISGVVYDPLYSIPVVGYWSGIGLVTVTDDEGTKYELEIPEQGTK